MEKNKKLVLFFEEISKKDLPLVGGKNSSLGEMMSALLPKGVLIPNGFATTSYAYFEFLKENNLNSRLKKIFADLDIDNVRNLQKVGREARKLISQAEFSEKFKKEIIESYEKLEKEYGKNVEVAVRSSATAEDLPGASFAG